MLSLYICCWKNQRVWLWHRARRIFETERIEKICEGAFYRTDLRKVYISDAEVFTIIRKQGSLAEVFALEQGYLFEAE